MDQGGTMKTALLQRLPMIPRLTASAGQAECLAHDYVGWELLEADDSTEEILICKPCAPAWEYTRSKHLLILCSEAAAAWQQNSAASVCDISEMIGYEPEVFVTLAEVLRQTAPFTRQAESA
jgi:hypothetical protein